MNNPWKITIPVSRAEERNDGLYLIGEASGPERDTHGTEMAPQAIVDFQRQIRERVESGDPLPYLDHHAKTGVLRELGSVMEGEITSDLHLRVAVRLDELNPAALFLHQSISRGKRYGMSISGTSDNFNIIRDDQGKRVIRFNQVALREISATTSPSWVPSFGTVLARSVDGVEDDEPVNRETTTSMPDPVTTSTAEQPTADLADAGTNSDVERGRIAKASLTSIQAAFDNFFKQLQTEIGLQGATEAPAATPEAAPTPAAAPAPENTSVENSDTGVETVDLDGLTVTRSQVDEVKAWSAALVERAVQPLRDQIAEKDKEIADAKQQIADLQAMPGKQRPAPSIPVDRAEGPDLSKMSPAEKIRFGLTGQL